MGVLRDYDTYQINIIQHKQKDYRIAKGFLWRTSPMGQRALYPKFKDTFYCRLPNSIWLQYEKRRIEITKDSIKSVAKSAKS